MHPGTEPRQEALADGAEGPLRVGHRGAYGAVAAGEDVLSEADDARLHRPALYLYEMIL